MQNVIICPNSEKIRVLKECKGIHPNQYMTKSEFYSSYYFSYDENTYFYLMKKYHYNLDVCKVYLENLYAIDLDKKYTHSKLIFLQDLKKELLEKKLLKVNPFFQKQMKNFHFEVSSYYDFDLYLEKVLGVSCLKEEKPLKNPVYAFSSMEDEISFVCTKIRDLLKSGVDITHIYLCGVDDSYYFLLDKIFRYYQIPIAIPYKHSIYSTTIVQDYLKTRKFQLDNPNEITKKLVSCINKLVSLEEGNIKEEIFIDLLKHTYLSNKTQKGAVEVKDILSYTFSNDDYVFLLGFNLDSIPMAYQDTSYITDLEKDEIEYYDVSYLNKREKYNTSYIISIIQNITITYKESTYSEKFYPSNFIKDYSMEVIRYPSIPYHYSNVYNQIKLGEMLDEYYVYGHKSKELDSFYHKYPIPYKTYQNQFSGISHDLLLENIDYPLKLSYTSFNSYQLCKFQYYLRYILKIGEYEDLFASYIGSLYHKILSLLHKDNFDFEKEWNSYLEKRELSLKEKILLIRIKKDLIELIDVLKKQKLLTGYDLEYHEKECKVDISNDVSVLFVGYIDKIMYYQKMDDFYFSIVDYKSGMIDTHIEPMKYGLHMQLPIYLYLIYSSNIFSNPIFTGIYYQNILFSYPTWSKDYNKNDNYKLKGYSTDNIELLSRFDSTYEDSSYIKGLKYSEEKGFSRTSKILDSTLLEEIVEFTKNKILETRDLILKGDFRINPKIYGKENISCSYCPYKDICYCTPNDFVELEKNEDFSFLGGEE